MAKLNLQDSEKARRAITQAQKVEIFKLYQQSYINLKNELDSITSGGRTSDSMRKAQLKVLVRQLKESYVAIGGDLEKIITVGMEESARAVVKDTNRWAENLGLVMKGAYSHVPRDIVEVLSSGKLYSKGWTLSKSIWGDSRKKLSDIDQVVATGVASNKSAYEIAKDLEKYVNPSAQKDWDWSKVYPGTAKTVDYNAQRLARTMVSHSYQQSLLATTKHNPFVKGYIWRSAHTHRTCEICAERDGQVYTVDTLPLDHPNGMCTYLVDIPDSLDDIADRLGDWANGKSDKALDKWYKSMRMN